ncbi:helix-turn-helix domain-containing protein [Microbacterium sp. E-13]|uniref:helix-turn-helix domain-containing protein n=1 Tax=Microbacterium sp. E-13 TaxID=3404048 RepID=UPI003CFAFFA9
MEQTTNPLGAFLRARREGVTPELVSLPAGDGRRVPGLRREEVAMLAGISADYYLRLEQGRDRNPSVQVLEALARVLHLDDDQFAHLLDIVAPAPRRRRSPDRVPPAGAVKLVATLAQPAFIENLYFDIVASNPLARAIDPRLAVGGNQLRDMFLDAEVQALYPDWMAATECLVGNLRRAVGKDVDDPRFVELTGQLALASPRFRDLWARNDVHVQTGSITRYHHPFVGPLQLNRERMGLDGADGMMLVVLHADAGSSDAEKLGLLASAMEPAP